MSNTSDITELFEKIAHPTRVKILKLLEHSPMSFGQLKKELGIGSSGNLDHHLKKLGNLIILGSDGLYKLSEEGKETLLVVTTIEVSLTTRKTQLYSQSRWLLGIVGAFFALFISAMVIATIPLGAEAANQMGLVGGMMGGVIGIIGAMVGLRGSVVADSRSSQPLTYWPNKRSPWQTADWVVHLLFIGGYLTLLFFLVYAQAFSPSYPYKPLWYGASLLASNTLFIASIIIGTRTIMKANGMLRQRA